jgi:hypothetical protein
VRAYRAQYASASVKNATKASSFLSRPSVASSSSSSQVCTCTVKSPSALRAPRADGALLLFRGLTATSTRAADSAAQHRTSQSASTRPSSAREKLKGGSGGGDGAGTELAEKVAADEEEDEDVEEADLDDEASTVAGTLVVADAG